METNETPVFGVCQTPVLKNRSELAHFLDLAAQDVQRHAPGARSMFLFPEIFWGGFDYDRSEELANATPALLQWLQKEAGDRGLLVGGTFWEKYENTLRNTFYLAGTGVEAPQRIRSKLQLFTFSAEHEHFSAGTRPPQPVDVQGVTCGVAICFELRFPEIFRHQGAQGMELMLLCSQWPIARAGHLEILTKARALENQSFLLSCNACGPSPAGQLAGGSRLVTPWGEDLFVCDDAPAVACAPLPKADLERARKAFDTRHCNILCTISCERNS